MSYETLNPATGEVIKTFAQISDAEVLAALKTADDRYHDDWRFRPVTERVKIMRRAAAILREQAGASVAERAGRKLKKAVLELGGSDPMIILEDAPLEHATDQAAIGRMMNMGEACVATKRVIVVGKERGRQVLDGLVKRLGSLKAGDPANPKTSI